MLKAGNTLYMPTGEMYRKPHLWALLCDPIEGENKVLIVNINTMRKDADSTCTLNVGDHPFIRHTSFVNYANSALVSVDKLEESLTTGRAEHREKLKEEVLKRIRQCLLVSPHTPIDVRNIWLKIMKKYD
ncbi:hypothetical protein JW948_16500 [bacterium]|nr:hypothetical protein [bacterium]